MAMNQTSARFLLRSAGRNLENARANLDRVMNDAKREMVLANKHGISPSEIARELGVTRQTVYVTLREAQAAEKANDDN